MKGGGTCSALFDEVFDPIQQGMYYRASQQLKMLRWQYWFNCHNEAARLRCRSIKIKSY